MRNWILVLLFVFSLPATAGPVVFDDVRYAVSAFAEVNGRIDGPFDLEGDGDGLPLLASADIVRRNGRAAASGIADTGFLAVTAEADAQNRSSGAVATAAFTGGFSGAGLYRLLIDFDNTLLTDGGDASALLAITLSAGAFNLIDELLLSNGRFERDIYIETALPALLDLSLIGTADAFDGNGFSLASVAFDLQRIPEPGGWGLFGLGMAAFVLVRRLPLSLRAKRSNLAFR